MFFLLTFQTERFTASYGMRAFLTYAISVFVLVFLPLASQARTGQVDPDIFANMQNYTDAPYFVRKVVFERGHVPDHWPFIVDKGEVSCVTVDGVALALFQMPGADEPYMFGENMIVTFIFGLVTDNNDYVAKNYDPAKLVVDIEKTYTAALIQCGPPYAQ